MRWRLLALSAVVAAALAWAAWALLDRQAAGTGGADVSLALPGFAEERDAVDRIEVRGAGDQSLVVLEKKDGRWRMPDRDGWPGNQREIGNALFRLGQAHRLEGKTSDPAKYARLGVEDVAGEAAKGTELRLAGAGIDRRLVIGNNHPSLGGSYVRVGDDPQAWLLDQDIGPARNPADWLDRRLLDIPMARIALIRVQPAQGRAFTLSRVEDRFSLDGKSPAAMANPDDGNATAGFTDQLPLDDVARDDGSAATQTVVFEGVDGVRVTVAAWPRDGQTWARLSVALDADAARAFLAAPAQEPAPAAGGQTATDTDTDGGAVADTSEVVAPATPEQQLAELEARVAAWQSAFEGRRFRLPAYKAASLMKTRDEYLAGTP